MSQYLVLYRMPSGWENVFCENKDQMKRLVNRELNNFVVEEIEVYECSIVKHYKFQEGTWNELDPETKLVIDQIATRRYSNGKIKINP